MWVFTVPSAMYNLPAISALVIPAAISTSTSRSRSVSRSSRGSAPSGFVGRVGTTWSSSRLVADGAITASPAATVRIAFSRSPGRASFSMKPLAPALRALKTYSSRSKVVSTSTRVRTPEATILRVASTPSITGMRMSIRTTSHCVRSTPVTVAAPSAASPTTRRSSSASISIRKPLRTSSWSSARNTVIGVMNRHPSAG